MRTSDSSVPEQGPPTRRLAPSAFACQRPAHTLKRGNKGRGQLAPWSRPPCPAPTWPLLSCTHGVAGLAQAARVAAPPEIAVVRARDTRQAPQERQAPDCGQPAAAPRCLHEGRRTRKSKQGALGPAKGSEIRLQAPSWFRVARPPARHHRALQQPLWVRRSRPAPLSSQLSLRPSGKGQILRRRGSRPAPSPAPPPQGSKTTPKFLHVHAQTGLGPVTTHKRRQPHADTDATQAYPRAQTHR